MIGDVIFADSAKILVKTDTKIVQLNNNDLTKGVKYKDQIDFDGNMVVSKVSGRSITICEPTQLVVTKKAPYKHKGHTEPKDKDLSNQGSAPAGEENKKNPAQSFSNEDQSKFLIASAKAAEYTPGGVVEKFGRLIEVSHIGKPFSFKVNKNMGGKKIRFKDGDQVCYVYYKKNEPVFSAEEFLKATQDYYAFIAYLKKNGIKPRHKASEITQIKKAKALCDSRQKIEGNSWIAIDADYLWYITHKLSPINIENNIKINNQFAQCWRIALHQISNKIPELEKIDLVLFKSSAIPNAQEDEEDELL